MDEFILKENKSNRSIELCRRIVTTESFIEEAMAIYGDRYNYDKVNYINGKQKVVIGCSIHGDFEIFAREHLDGKGCPICEKSDKFLTKLKDKFGDKFGLDYYVYKNSTTPITLICPKHGSFKRLPNSILSSQFGCPQCGMSANQEACDKRHQEAENRKAEEYKIKEAEIKAKYQIQIDEFNNTELKYKTLMQRWLKNPNMQLPRSEDLFGGYDIYRRLVELYKRIIKNDALWIEEYKNQHRLSYSEAKKLSHFQIGDEVYLFIGEAPDRKIIEDYKRNSFYDIPFNEFLSGSGCEVIFENGDLFIYIHPLLSGIKPEDIAGSIEVERFRNMEKPIINPQRKVASQMAIIKYREQYPDYSDELLVKYVEDLYPNIYEEPLIVAEEIIKELYRNQEDLTEDMFKLQLVYWSDHYKLIGYTKACKKFEEVIRQYNALIEYIYTEAQKRTLYLSECREYAFEGVKEYISSLYEDKDKTLAQKFFTLLNNRALHDSDQISGYILPFHCYGEPNGDVVFTKHKRSLECWDAEGKPIVSEKDIEQKIVLPLEKNDTKNTIAVGFSNKTKIIIFCVIMILFILFIIFQICF